MYHPIQFKNSADRYGLVAIALHWLMAVLIIGLLALGLYMTGLPTSLLKLKLFGWHKEFGILVLMLLLARLSWRLFNMHPQLTIPLWEKWAALAMHCALYVFMAAMPLTGWMLSSAAGVSVSFFGLFTLPNLISANPHLKHLLAEAHEWLAYGLITAIIFHSLAAFKHHLIDKDTILRRMFP